MNFDLNEEQRLLADSVRRFVANDYAFDARKAIVASPQGMSAEAWRTIAELGLLALPLPTAHGGFGGGAVDLMAVMEAFGDALVVEPYASTVVCARMLERSVVRPAPESGLPSASSLPREGGDPISLPALAEGALKLAFAHTEDGARYELAHVATRARRDGDGYVLDGVKRVVLHAPQADRLLVSARTAGDIASEAGISLFAVDPTAPGVTMRAYRTIDELRGADVEFRGVRVGAEALVGAEGAAHAIVDEAMDFATALLCAEAVGALKYANDATLEYLKARKQFGVPIGSFQALQHRMVDMVIEAEQARSLASLACATVDGAKDVATRRRIVSAAKIKVADACRHVSQESVQLHGGMGMTEELKVSHTFRRLTMLRQQLGDADHHLARYASLDRSSGSDAV